MNAFVSLRGVFEAREQIAVRALDRDAAEDRDRAGRRDRDGPRAGGAQLHRGDVRDGAHDHASRVA